MMERNASSNEGAGQRVARRRSIAIAVTLAVLVVLFYAATLVHLGGNVANRGM
jgi:uncharacterized membrane protein YdfJ with MMPL/SSD domain